jgi:hypothetical protein
LIRRGKSKNSLKVSSLKSYGRQSIPIQIILMNVNQKV